MTDYTKSDARFSDCRTWRYTLERWWSPFALGRYVNFIMLNPSTADEVDSDPTVRRCLKFANDWGYDGCIVTNLFAYRATDPMALRDIQDPVGPSNNEAILNAAQGAARVVCAWGVHGAFLLRGRIVYDLLTARKIELSCIAKTKQGHPMHPLYLPATSRPGRFTWE